MKITMKKSFAVVMALVMCVSVFFGINLSAFAADNTVNYVTSGSYIYNWGTRGTAATFLSPNAETFYTENGVTLSGLLALDGSSTESGVPSSALYQKLQQLMTDNHSYVISYDNTRPLFMYTDCQNSGSPSTISSFYSGAEIGPEWDGGSTWNREHTWPNSKGDLAGDGENDIMMLRPAATSENGSRSNKAYGTTTDSNYFYPNIGSYDLRGDVARIILYQYVRWGCTNTGSTYNSTGIFGVDGVIESQDVLLTWVKEDPVDTWELGRNDSVEAITGTRNVFVDYPELAFDLFNESVPTGYTSPSGGADVEGTTGDDTPSAPTSEILFNLGDNGTASHSDGSSAANYTETVGDYTLTLASLVKVYSGACDATGNSALKLGTSSVAGSFSITVPDDVISVKFNVAGYKATNAKISVNGTAYTISTLSNNGEYTAITVDTTTTKTVSFTTASGGYRCMIDSIAYAVADSSGDGEDSGNSGDSGDSGDSTQTTEVNATITFDDTGLDSTETEAQIWFENGVTVTNNKGTASSAFYTTVTDHTRFYKGNQIVVEYEYPISKIVFTTTGSSYNTNLANSLTSSGLGTVTSSSSTITLELTTPSTTVTFDHTNNATRVKSMDITALKPAAGGEDTDTYTITATVNNNSNGSVEVSDKYITAIPADGYEVSGYEIISGNTNATVTQSGNNFTVETDADVTIQINFVARTQYTVTFKEMGSTTSTQNAYSGDSITLPSITSDDYTVVGWVAAEIDGEITDKPTVYDVGSNYNVTASTTFYALYSRTEAGGSGDSDVFAKYTGTITEGDYLIVYDGGAMKAAVSSSRLSYTSVTESSGSITSPDASLIWTVAADGEYYTLYNESTAKYAASTGAKNKAQLLSSVDDKARWTVSGTATYEFVNKQNTASGVNANLRRNGTYGFACYATSTGGALTLYKRTAAAMTTYYFTDSGEQVTYTVTANANNGEYGTVNVSGTTISATPAEGYTISGYIITSGTATVTQEGSTFFVTPSSDVVITINFEALPTYTVTFVEDGTTVSTDFTYSGGFITLPAHTGELDANTTFDGWAAQENETDTAKIYAAGSKYAVTGNVTLYAQYTVTVVETASHNFNKVTENLDDYTGTYLVVYEEGNAALNGAISDDLDVANNTVGVQIVDGKIAATDTNLLATVVIEKTDGGYTMRTKGGLFFGSQSDSNSLLNNATKTYVNTITVDADGNAVITGEGGAILRFNATSGQNRFRFYKTASYAAQQPIALYKLDVADITGAQVTVGSDLTMKYYVDVTNLENVNSGDLTMRFSIDGEVIDTVSGTVVDSQYVFDFVGLAPQRMADIIKAEILYKGSLIDVKDNYSIKLNAQNLLDANTDNAKLTQFITDMLYYGAAAQSYTKYNTDNLATSGVTGLGTPTNIEPTETDNAFNLTSTTGNAGFRSATVWFDVTNRLIVKVSKKTDDVNVKVYATASGGTRTELTYNSDIGGYMTGEINVTDFGTAYTFELCDESDNVIQTLTYSVNSYAYSKYQNYKNTNMQALALALFRLGQSAEEL